MQLPVYLPPYFLYALAAAFLWGLSPIMTKRGMANGGNFYQASWVLVVVSGSVFFTILFVIRPDPLGTLSSEVIYVFFLGGLIGTTGGRICAFISVNEVGASITSAVISIRSFFACLFALAFLDEALTISLIAGIVLILIGLFVLSTSRGGDRSGWTYGDLVVPVVAAMAFAGGNVLRRYGLNVSDGSLFEALVINEAGALVGLVLIFPFFGPETLRRPSLKSYSYFFGTAFLVTLALYNLFRALSTGPVVIIDPVVSISPLFSVLFAWLFLKQLERVSLKVWAGAAAIVLGTAIIGLFGNF